MKLRLLETGYVLALFGGYLALWRWKRVSQRRATGRDPEVLGEATAPLQRYFARATGVLTVAAVLVISAHALDLRAPGLTPLPGLEAGRADHAGLLVGVLGLALCALAQRTMGASWRVGIDEGQATALVTRGVYGRVRNPTYLGLYLVNAGFWLIWPSCAVAMFGLAFFLLLEVQVRCEEEHLLRLHGDVYRSYLARTRRYLPWIY